MKNFGRIVRLALRYRLTLVFSVICALGVAVLWGGNIGAVYPFVEVTFKGDSLHTWIDEEIAATQRAIGEGSDEIERLKSQLAEAPLDRQRGIRVKIGLVESRVAAEQVGESVPCG